MNREGSASQGPRRVRTARIPRRRPRAAAARRRSADPSRRGGSEQYRHQHPHSLVFAIGDRGHYGRSGILRNCGGPLRGCRLDRFGARLPAYPRRGCLRPHRRRRRRCELAAHRRTRAGGTGVPDTHCGGTTPGSLLRLGVRRGIRGNLRGCHQCTPAPSIAHCRMWSWPLFPAHIRLPRTCSRA